MKKPKRGAKVKYPVENLAVLESVICKGATANSLKVGVFQRRKSGSLPKSMKFLFRTVAGGALVTRVK